MAGADRHSGCRGVVHLGPKCGEFRLAEGLGNGEAGEVRQCGLVLFLVVLGLALDEPEVGPPQVSAVAVAVGDALPRLRFQEEASDRLVPPVRGAGANAPAIEE